LNDEGHLTESMGRAADARIVGADESFDTIQHARSQALPANEMFRDLQDAAIHGQVVLASGDHQICPPDETALIDLVVMEKRTAGRFATHAFQAIGASHGAHLPGKNFRIIEELLEARRSKESRPACSESQLAVTAKYKL
jgi:hypothetical protein